MIELRSKLLEELTWVEIESAINRGVKTVLVPAGSVEQHGPHLGILKDAAWAEAIGVEVAKDLGDAVVAPVIRPGCSDHHMGFSGTISYRPETLMRVLEDYCRSLDSHGFDHIVLFSLHGGNFPAMNAILPSIADEADAQIITLLDKELLIDPLMASLAQMDIPSKARGHGGAAVTASVLHLRPDLVLEEEFTPGFTGNVSTSKLMTNGLDEVTELGHMGDPTYATPELGKEVTTRLVSAFSERIRTERGDSHE
ncbi:creatininase family protein [Halalkalicoccus sp. NIPERK01]|uniref:creatininase family protein n=1 Tax=Halalkalicoccus sp. NIPERK01 TaxID=3053469 RepID=UPI00256F611F|nr:creatininase family protein [Halalkalicoccus sp. NIPERK01]MDL5363395.1 creatininase family protein [Halalkalicoccus sp. NIPERK01]